MIAVRNFALTSVCDAIADPTKAPTMQFDRLTGILRSVRTISKLSDTIKPEIRAALGKLGETRFPSIVSDIFSPTSARPERTPARVMRSAML